MTEQRQYCISKERLLGLQAIYGIAQETIDEVMMSPCSRPAPAALTHDDGGNCLVTCQHCHRITQVKCKDNATIRNQTLDEAIRHLKSKREGVMRISQDMSSLGVLDGTISYLESLRTHEHQRGDQR